jgi:hypothetical protein
VQASGVQAASRNARVNVEGVDHGKANIVLKRAAAIATKARTRTASREHLERSYEQLALCGCTVQRAAVRNARVIQALFI